MHSEPRTLVTLLLFSYSTGLPSLQNEKKLKTQKAGILEKPLQEKARTEESFLYYAKERWQMANNVIQLMQREAQQPSSLNGNQPWHINQLLTKPTLTAAWCQPRGNDRFIRTFIPREEDDEGRRRLADSAASLISTRSIYQPTTSKG